MSYPSLTELTRNPARDRSPIEKNWMLFFTPDEAYVQYELSPQRGRAFAKLLGGGLTTPNLTDPLELPCLPTAAASTGISRGNGDASSGSSSPMDLGSGTWHQATNSLRLVLCRRADARCRPTATNTVFFAVVHRKRSNALHLPLRYERFVVVWAAAPPFGMLGVSRHPLLMANETASGWLAAENWDDWAGHDDGDGDGTDGNDGRGVGGGAGRGLWAGFTYTVSIAYAWRGPGDEVAFKNTGFLDDEVIVSIGVNDGGQVFARVPAQELLQCLKACPGRDA
jgi:hypothetical protein